MNAPPYVCPSCVQPLLFENSKVLTGAAAFLLSKQSYSPGIFNQVRQLDPNQAFAKTGRTRTPARLPSRHSRGSVAFNRSVLVVDDVADVTEMIGLFLKHAGYEVTTANSADIALSLAASRQFDLIISDIGMPDMNGYQLAESLRSQAEYRNTPLVAVTGYTEYDDRGRSLEAGFDAHLTKPINPSQLLDLIRELLRR